MIMYARITRAHYDPTQEKELTRLAQEQLPAAFRRIPGFKSCTGGVDRTTRQTFTLSIWETEEQATNVPSAPEAHALGEIVAQFQAAGGVFDVAPEVYEVTVQS